MNAIVSKMVNNPTVGKLTLKVSEKSPTIMMVAGIAGIGIGSFMLAKATYDFEAIKHNADEIESKIEETHREYGKIVGTDGSPVYPESSYNKDLALARIRRYLSYAKLYLPVASLIAGGVYLVVGGHHILVKRNSALIAAYKLLDRSYSDYRKRVSEKVGNEEESYLYHGAVKETRTDTIVDDAGKKEKIKTTSTSYVDGAKSPYSRWFDETNVQFHHNQSYNMMFLNSQQQYANDLLRARGHIFLNEVYDMLNIPRTPEGQVVGWTIDGDGDSFVDFGIDSPENADFIAGNNRPLLLDFNVDGVIYNAI